MSLPESILNIRNNQFFTLKTGLKDYIITRASFARNGINNSNIISLLLTEVSDGVYSIPALLIPSQVQTKFKLSDSNMNDCQELVGRMINIDQYMVSAFRKESQFQPYLIVLNFDISSQEGIIQEEKNVPNISSHPDVQQWLEKLQLSIPDKSRPLSSYFKLKGTGGSFFDTTGNGAFNNQAYIFPLMPFIVLEEKFSAPFEKVEAAIESISSFDNASQKSISSNASIASINTSVESPLPLQPSPQPLKQKQQQERVSSSFVNSLLSNVSRKINKWSFWKPSSNEDTHIPTERSQQQRWTQQQRSGSNNYQKEKKESTLSSSSSTFPKEQEQQLSKTSIAISTESPLSNDYKNERNMSEITVENPIGGKKSNAHDTTAETDMLEEFEIMKHLSEPSDSENNPNVTKNQKKTIQDDYRSNKKPAVANGEKVEMEVIPSKDSVAVSDKPIDTVQSTCDTLINEATASETVHHNEMLTYSDTEYIHTTEFGITHENDKIYMKDEPLVQTTTQSLPSVTTMSTTNKAQHKHSSVKRRLSNSETPMKRLKTNRNTINRTNIALPSATASDRSIAVHKVAEELNSTAASQRHKPTVFRRPTVQEYQVEIRDKFNSSGKACDTSTWLPSFSSGTRYLIMNATDSSGLQYEKDEEEEEASILNQKQVIESLLKDSSTDPFMRRQLLDKYKRIS
ncbi:hypothetical protein BDF20DRAFT_896136 [Mycotypha africana]|uniref:uncharacterized protein n=1 Tax=Mycotypha africana TaxID=64632 RepID=UPI002301ABCC|nr:uncharacterized protein BDF20DRAFT_896136 [Mycotypha africana]KAI8968400.1 hypothetical protein BDF20DRAFT_896136 [Mycotypha africana]